MSGREKQEQPLQAERGEGREARKGYTGICPKSVQGARADDLASVLPFALAEC